MTVPPPDLFHDFSVRPLDGLDDLTRSAGDKVPGTVVQYRLHGARADGGDCETSRACGGGSRIAYGIDRQVFEHAQPAPAVAKDIGAADQQRVGALAWHSLPAARNDVEQGEAMRLHPRGPGRSSAGSVAGFGADDDHRHHG